MGLYLGSEIKGVYCGSTEVKEAYVGGVKVYGKESPAPAIDPDILLCYYGNESLNIGLNPDFKSSLVVDSSVDSPLDLSGTGLSSLPPIVQKQSYFSWKSSEVLNYGNSTTTKFTIEVWVKHINDSTSIRNIVFCFFNDSSNYWNLGLGMSRNTFYSFVKDSYFGIGSGIENEWNHLAMVANGENCSFYVNGVLKTTRSRKDNYTDSNNLGFLNDSDRHCCYMTQMCLTKRAKWTKNFTPPTKPYFMGM